MRFGNLALVHKEPEPTLELTLGVPSSLMNQTCTLILRSTAGTADVYGNATWDETTVTTVCELQQRQSDEPGQAGEFARSLWDCFFPTGTTLDTGDAVVVSGHGTFEVVGEPWDADQASSAVNHAEAVLRRTAGAA